MQLDLYHSKPIELTEKCLTFVQQTLQKNFGDAVISNAFFNYYLTALLHYLLCVHKNDVML